jgi:hypothetical protein
VQSITAREMAALRSALPSPRKQKGEKLKQELGIKAGEHRGCSRRGPGDMVRMGQPAKGGLCGSRDVQAAAH